MDIGRKLKKNVVVTETFKLNIPSIDLFLFVSKLIFLNCVPNLLNLSFDYLFQFRCSKYKTNVPFCLIWFYKFHIMFVGIYMYLVKQL